MTLALVVMMPHDYSVPGVPGEDHPNTGDNGVHRGGQPYRRWVFPGDVADIEIVTSIPQVEGHDEPRICRFFIHTGNAVRSLYVWRKDGSFYEEHWRESPA